MTNRFSSIKNEDIIIIIIIIIVIIIIIIITNIIIVVLSDIGNWKRWNVMIVYLC